jgi:hypothetical protein
MTAVHSGRCYQAVAGQSFEILVDHRQAVTDFVDATAKEPWRGMIAENSSGCLATNDGQSGNTRKASLIPRGDRRPVGEGGRGDDQVMGADGDAGRR